MERNLYTPPNAPVKDRTEAAIQLSWSLTLIIWWSFVWRSAIYSFVGGVVSGGIAGAIAGVTGHLDKASVAGAIAGYITGIALSLPALKQALQKHQNRMASL